MKAFKIGAVAALLTGALAVTGCQRSEEPAFRDEANQAGEEVREFGQDVEKEAEGIGGSGDDNMQIGDEEGVFNDGEGPLENEQTRPGEEPGVINDGEGPVEENF